MRPRGAARARGAAAAKAAARARAKAAKGKIVFTMRPVVKLVKKGSHQTGGAASK
jgi:hypothetical protein